MTDFTKIRAQKEGSVLHLRLSYPERRNAIGPQMVNELLHALDEAAADREVRVVVLSGEGKAFCAGGDFAQMTSAPGDSNAPSLAPKGDYADLLLAMVRTKKPIVAKVHGAAMGGGLGLVAASTLVVASTEAEFGTPEILVGLFPMMIMAVLARLVPRRRLLEMMLLGERLSAVAAKDIGLVNQVVTPEALDAAVVALCAKLSAKSPMTMQLGLRAFADQDTLPLEQALPMLRDRLAECLSTDDAREGLTAFLEKRLPRFTGT